MVKYDIITRPKKEGGLGIQKVILKNDTILSSLA